MTCSTRDRPTPKALAVLRRTHPAATRVPLVVLTGAAVPACIGGDRQLPGDLLDIFRADSPGHLQAIRDAVGGADEAALMRAAHTLNGSLRVLGAATDLMGEIEALGREGRLAGAAALLPRLELKRVQVAAARAVTAGTPA